MPNHSVARVRSGGLFVALVAGVLGGCASAALYPPPTPGQVAAADSAIMVARQDGSTKDPNAARHLRFAEQQLASAKQAAANQDNRTAALMLARANADAELSLALSKKARAEASATEAERVLSETRGPDSLQNGNTPTDLSVPAPPPSPASGSTPPSASTSGTGSAPPASIPNTGSAPSPASVPSTGTTPSPASTPSPGSTLSPGTGNPPPRTAAPPPSSQP